MKALAKLSLKYYNDYKNKRLKLIKDYGLNELAIRYIDTLNYMEIDMCQWGCKQMQYKIHKSNGYITWAKSLND